MERAALQGMNQGVYCIGSVVFDGLVRPVEAMPGWGTITFVDSISNHLGGNGSAAAYTVARMGVPAKLAAVIGRDPAGEHVAARLRQAGVDLSQLQVRDDVPTARTVGLVNRQGERLFFHDPGALGVFTAAQVSFQPEVVRGYAFFHYGTIFCLPAVRPHASQVLVRARRAGLRTSLDVDWDFMGRWLDDLGPLCPLIDYLFLNTQEAEMLTGSREPAQVGGFFLERGVGVVVLKMAERGCAVFSKTETFSLPAFQVQAVDTTGAGDCFCGGFLAGLCRGWSLRESARLANAAGAQSVVCVGNTDGVQGFEATTAWMDRAQTKT